jgi:hypothetical protein
MSSEKRRVFLCKITVDFIGLKLYITEVNSPKGAAAMKQYPASVGSFDPFYFTQARFAGRFERAVSIGCSGIDG